MMLAMVMAVHAFCQVLPDRSEVRSGNRDFRKNRFKEAEIDYRRALVKDSTSLAANYNLANTLYRMEEFQEASRFIDTAENSAQGTAREADVYYNKGNIALQEKNYNTAVDAFKQALLLSPDDLDAKENYIYARKMLQDQQQNGGGDGQNDQNQDQNQNSDDKQNQDQNQDQNKDQNKDQDQNPNQKDDSRDDPRPQPQDGQMTPQQAEQMLQAIEQKEKDTQDKVKKEEALRAKSRQKEKNW